MAAVRAVAGGGVIVDPGLLPRMISTAHQNPRGVTGLSGQEREALRLVGGGLSNQQIAEALCVSHSSAESYASALLRKLEVNTRAQAALIAAQEGLVGTTPTGQP